MTQMTYSAPTLPFSVEHGTVDGVRTVAAALPVDPTITLTFGVGYTDASPATAGLTHLVEHLVRRRVGSPPGTDLAGSGLLSTSFSAVGAADERADFVRRVCEAVTWLGGITDADLDPARRSILAEIGPSGIYAARDAFSTRYGPRGPGVTAVTHARLLDWTAAEVREEATRWFHRDNAYLLSTTALPEGLSLPLPTGPALARAPHPESLVVGPSWSHGPGETVTLTGTCSTSLDDARRSVAAELLRHVLQGSLRTRSGQRCPVDLTRLPAGPDGELWALTTDPHEASVGDALVAALDAVDRLARHGPTPEELDRTRATLLRQLGLPGTRASWLHDFATSTLRGRPCATVEEAARAATEVTAEDVRAAVAQLAASLLVTLPAGFVPDRAAAARLDRLTFVEANTDPGARTHSHPDHAGTADRDRTRLGSARVDGGRFYSAKYFSPARGLRLGILPDRFVLLKPGATWVIPFSDIVLVGSDADGDVELVTARGGAVVIPPRFFRGLAGPLALALDRVPLARVYEKDRTASALPPTG